LPDLCFFLLTIKIQDAKLQKLSTKIKNYSFLVFTCIWVVGGQPQNGEAILGLWLAVRCEQSEHGKSQLSIKYFCTIFYLLF